MQAAVTPRASSEERLIFLLQILQHFPELGLMNLIGDVTADNTDDDQHGGEDHGELTVSLTSGTTRVVLLLVATLGGILIGQTLTRFTNASLPFMDSTLTSFSIAAQWMQTQKLLESWLVWLVVDVFYVGMFLYKELYLTAGLYAVFLVLAAMGFSEWRRSMRGGESPAPELAS